ncbi:MAG TPA: hypothetical protein VMS31_22480 [Pyrinomonadaceae bacterium]|nr:hypothetical protein [Pyrinomonadaceae bacterium]
MNAVISIVPRLPPAIDGLGDFAFNLARQLSTDFRIESRFIVGDPSWAQRHRADGFSASCLPDRSTAALLSRLNVVQPAPVLLLHYVGYGYSLRGAPVWLVNGLERWVENNEGARLLTVFHEVYASGPVWTSSFWLSPLQKHLAGRLARLSDACFTSRQGYAEVLRTLSRRKHTAISILPVFSNIGEPDHSPLALKERRPQLVVFGSGGNRARVYAESLPALENVCQALAIEKIFDVGPPAQSIVPAVNGIPVVEMGQRTADEISALMSKSIAGFFDYNTGYLAKSTIFAAYSAHNLIPISATCDDAQVDGLEAGKHYWVANPHVKDLSLAAGQKIADNAYAWYQTHKLSEHVKAFAGEICHPKDLCLV